MVDRELFAFVQLVAAGSVGLDDARYLAREPDERVLVARVANAPAAPPRRLRRRRPRAVDPEPERPLLAASTLTVIRPVGLGSEADARAWLEAVRGDADATAAEITAAVSLINRAIAARRAEALDPYLADVSAEHAVAVRIGYGPGEQVADGRWEQAFEVPRGERRRRPEVLRPQEAIAGLLAGREPVPASVALLLRARADLDARRLREAALQLRVGLEALLAELDRDPIEPRAGEARERHRADLRALRGRRPEVADAADAALGGDLRPERAAAVAETLAICERVLRRRRVESGATP